MFTYILLIIILLIIGAFFYLKVKKIKTCRQNLTQHKKQLKHHQTEFNNVLSKKNKSYDDIFYIAQCYNYGFLDKTIDDKYIKGVKPNFEKSINYYKLLINTPYHYIACLNLGNIYNHEYLPGDVNLHKHEAKKYYKMAERSNNVRVKTEAYEKLKILKSELNELEEELIDINEIIQGDLYIIPSENEPLFLLEEEVIDEQNLIKNDTQNVHDSGVVNSIKYNVEHLKKNTVILFKSEEINNYIKSSPYPDNIKENAYTTLSKMRQINSFIVSANCHEIELLVLIYNKIESIQNSEIKLNIQNNLVLQLSECIEHGEVVCSQGRFNHVIACLDLLEENKIIPLWAIKLEMQNKAIQLRNQLETKINPNSDDFDRILKIQLKEQFYNDYAEKGLMTRNSIDLEVDSWF